MERELDAIESLEDDPEGEIWGLGGSKASYGEAESHVNPQGSVRSKPANEAGCISKDGVDIAGR